MAGCAEARLDTPDTQQDERHGAEEDDGATLSARDLLLQLIGALVLVMVMGVGVVWVFGDALESFGAGFVRVLGPWGILLAYAVPDMTGIPVPPDTFVLVALSGGMALWEVIVYGSVGSIVGGSLGYFATRLARSVPWIADRMERRAAEMERLVMRYGVGALAAGALTPLPYSLVAWACGLLGMPFRTFLLVSLLRIVRVVLYALPVIWALEQG